ncbi:MAG: DUF4435 domain-containing protein [Bacteroidota bacterium]|nr:DUF4435 domain-containing protein [Bacteroidota bacterium]
MAQRTPHGLANSIRLKRQLNSKCFVVVEGHDDRLFFENVLDQDKCQIEVAFGKRNVTAVMSILETGCVPGVVGVVDADFDHIEDTHPSINNLIVLETVDLEALLIRSRALDRVLVNWGKREKTTRFPENIREALLTAALWIGCLRLYSLRSQLNLRFRDVRYSRCIDSKSFAVNPKNLITKILDHSQRQDLSVQEIMSRVNSIHESIVDPWILCFGKDMTGILSVGLRHLLGSNKSQDIRPEQLRRYLSLGFCPRDLEESELGRELHDWEERNPTYRILKSPV